MDEKTTNNYKTMIFKRWEGDKEMCDWCFRTTQEAIEFDGCFYEIKKPKIKTNFCFGYGCYLQSTDEEEDRANGMVDYARSSTSYFLEKNLEDLTKRITALEKEGATVYLRLYPDNFEAVYGVFTGDLPKNENGKYTNWRDEYDRKATTQEATELLNAFKRVRDSFVKRLNTYLKRYGLSKINAWSYLVD